MAKIIHMTHSVQRHRTARPRPWDAGAIPAVVRGAMMGKKVGVSRGTQVVEILVSLVLGTVLLLFLSVLLFSL